MVLLFFAPESPWWLLRRGRKQEALRSIKRLGYNTEVGANEAFAMMERTVEIEAHAGGSPTLLDLWKGVDLRRTIITCLVYASQNFAGNLIANQATFFFERAGMDVSIALRCTNSPQLETDETACRQTSPSSSASSTPASNLSPLSCRFP
jgi:SP family general alpha glucoside:H+ symporter-like MFS transporter